MRRVSGRFLHATALVSLLTIVATNGAFAAPRNGDDAGWMARFQRFAHFIVVTISDQLGGPPG